jgi:hypothetical protein
MSVLPAAAATASIQAAAEMLNPMDELISAVNSSPYFVGTMMLLLNLGGRFLSMEVTPGQEKFLSSPTIRRLLLIVVLFVATRNIVIAICFGILVIILLGYLFNEKSDLCLWHPCHIGVPEEKPEAFTDVPSLTQEETTILDMLLKKREAIQASHAWRSKQQDPKSLYEPDSYGSSGTTSASYIYNQSLSKLRSLF